MEQVALKALLFLSIFNEYFIEMLYSRKKRELVRSLACVSRNNNFKPAFFLPFFESNQNETHVDFLINKPISDGNLSIKNICYILIFIQVIFFLTNWKKNLFRLDFSSIKSCMHNDLISALKVGSIFIFLKKRSEIVNMNKKTLTSLIYYKARFTLHFKVKIWLFN